jgi:hypothetical protein
MLLKGGIATLQIWTTPLQQALLAFSNRQEEAIITK